MKQQEVGKKEMLATVAALVEVLNLNIFNIEIGQNTCLPEHYHHIVKIGIVHFTEDESIETIYCSFIGMKVLNITDFSEDENIKNIILLGGLNRRLENGIIKTYEDIKKYLNGEWHDVIDEEEV